MTDRQKLLSDLEGLTFDDWHMFHCDSDVQGIAVDALELLKEQSAIVDALVKVGYPHNFQREAPWIVNYMLNITDVVRKAIDLRNREEAKKYDRS